MTYRQFEKHFRQEIMPGIIQAERKRQFTSWTDRRLAWIETVEQFHEMGMVSDKQLQNWVQPGWLETLKR